jgi:hypothetical protein
MSDEQWAKCVEFLREREWGTQAIRLAIDIAVDEERHRLINAYEQAQIKPCCISEPT